MLSIFDGIWAQASLLHLTKSEMPLAIEKCANALKDGGLFYASFKKGFGEKLDNDKRFFSYYQSSELKQIFQQTNHFSSIEVIEDKNDTMQRNDLVWLTVVAKKKPKPILKIKQRI